MQDPLYFYKSIFQYDSTSLNRVHFLVKKGVTFAEEGTMMLKAFFKKWYFCTLTNSLSSILKNPETPTNVKLIEVVQFWIRGLEFLVKEYNEIIDVKLVKAQEAIKEAINNFVQTQSIVPEVIQLKDAKVIGQKVKGSTESSIYKCIAFNDRVKLAYRVKNNVLSFRAEVDKATSSEIDSLCLNMHKKVEYLATYVSLHINIPEDVPIGRLVWGFIGGLNIKFDEVINLAGPKIEDFEKF